MSDTSEQRDPWTTQADATVDLGELGCGDLVMEMSKAIARLVDGEVICVHAYDPAAYIDIPAWCGMRGFDFLGGPNGKTRSPYYIRKRSQSHG